MTGPRKAERYHPAGRVPCSRAAELAQLQGTSRTSHLDLGLSNMRRRCRDGVSNAAADSLQSMELQVGDRDTPCIVRPASGSDRRARPWPYRRYGHP